MLTLNITDKDIELLSYAKYKEKNILLQKRLHVLHAKAITNLSHEEIGKLSGVSANSVTNYINIWNKGGYAAICKVGYGTKRSELEQHNSVLLSHFELHPPQNVNEAVQKIKELTNLQRSPTQVRAWFKRNGLKYRKTGHIPCKADPEKQQDFVQQTLDPLIEQAQNQDIHLLFLDAAHLVMGVFLCYLWSVKRVFIKSSAGRQRHNVLGAVNAITKQIHFISNQSYINAEVIIDFLEQLRNFYQDGKPIYIVLDNARYQKCEVVRYAAYFLNIHLIFLPPYSPNLNIIERLWKWLKKKCLYATFYESFQKFKQNINQTLENAHINHKTELDSLLNLKFQMFE